MKPKAVVAWSSGKDAAFALHVVRQTGDLDIVGLVTTVTDDFARVSMHGVREELLDLQCQSLGLPCTKVRIPFPCPNEAYDSAMEVAMRACRSAGVRIVVFGDLFLEEVRQYRQARLGSVGMHAQFPLWQRDTRSLAQEMLTAGMVATVTCVDPRRVEAGLAGRRFDQRLLAELPPSVDPCGENGEFHTVATAGPMFSAPLRTEVGPIVERDGFVYADVMPT